MNEDDDDYIFYDTLEEDPTKKVHDEDVNAFHKRIDSELLEKIGNLSLDHNASELEDIRSLLEAGANPDLIFESNDEELGSNNSLLHKAALCKNPDLAEMLLQYGADSKVRNSLGKTPIALINPSNIRVMNIFKASFVPKPLDISTPSSPTEIARSLSPNDQTLLTDMIAELKLLRSEVSTLKQQPRSQGSSIDEVEEGMSAPASQNSATNTPQKPQEVEINSFNDLKENYSPQAMRRLIVRLANNNDAQENAEEQIKNALTTYLPRIIEEYTKAKKALDNFGPSVDEKKGYDKTRITRHSELSSKASQLQSDIVAIYDYSNRTGNSSIKIVLDEEKAKLPPAITAVLARSMSPHNAKALETQRRMALNANKGPTEGAFLSELSNRFKGRGGR